MSKVIGRCVGETSLVSVSFISKEMPRVGEYVSLKYDGKNVLGMIESLVRVVFPLMIKYTTHLQLKNQSN